MRLATPRDAFVTKYPRNTDKDEIEWCSEVIAHAYSLIRDALRGEAKEHEEIDGGCAGGASMSLYDAASSIDKALGAK